MKRFLNLALAVGLVLGTASSAHASSLTSLYDRYVAPVLGTPYFGNYSNYGYYNGYYGNGYGYYGNSYGSYPGYPYTSNYVNPYYGYGYSNPYYSRSIGNSWLNWF